MTIEAVERGPIRAAILDLDGVITRTATLHARAWRRTLDAFLADRRAARSAHDEEDLSPFDLERDYRRRIDGKPRYDGVRDFLSARGIRLPEGEPDDEPELETVHGLGHRKNEVFQALLREDGVEVWPDAVERIRRWRERGLGTALITSSRNGRAVVEAAGIGELFDVVVDGVDAAGLGLPGKPAPDIFLEAARRLGVEPGETLVVEDAVAGVEAGRAGGFGRVVGVDRDGGGALREHGADVVVRDLRELDAAGGAAAGTGGGAPPDALERIDAIDARLRGRRPAFFLDYDGTLTPIVRRPDQAVLSEAMRSRLRTLAADATVAIVSGRDLDDVRSMVGLDALVYAGSHGFDIAGPDGLRMRNREAESRIPALEAAERRLRDRLRDVTGAWVERKRYALAVHYREAADRDVPRIEAAVDEALAVRPGLRKRGGKKIFELQPDVSW
ncbi:MAG: trehalose-phosphatase, partial [Gemmatimonadota bacterium]